MSKHDASVAVNQPSSEADNDNDDESQGFDSDSEVSSGGGGRKAMNTFWAVMDLTINLYDFLNCREYCGTLAATNSQFNQYWNRNRFRFAKWLYRQWSEMHSRPDLTPLLVVLFGYGLRASAVESSIFLLPSAAVHAPIHALRLLDCRRIGRSTIHKDRQRETN